MKKSGTHKNIQRKVINTDPQEMASIYISLNLDQWLEKAARERQETFLNSEWICPPAEPQPLNEAIHLQRTSHTEAHLTHDTGQGEEAETAERVSTTPVTRKLWYARRAILQLLKLV